MSWLLFGGSLPGCVPRVLLPLTLRGMGRTASCRSTAVLPDR